MGGVILLREIRGYTQSIYLIKSARPMLNAYPMKSQPTTEDRARVKLLKEKLLENPRRRMAAPKRPKRARRDR